MMTICGACHEETVPAPVFVDEDGSKVDCVEERCTSCGQLWQYPDYPPAKILDRKFQPPEPEPPLVDGDHRHIDTPSCKTCGDPIDRGRGPDGRRYFDPGWAWAKQNAQGDWFHESCRPDSHESGHGRLANYHGRDAELSADTLPPQGAIEHQGKQIQY